MCPNIEINSREEREKFVKNSLHYFGDKKLLVYPTFKGSLSQKKVEQSSKNPINTPSVFVYTRTGNIFRKAGRVFNIYVFPIAGEKYISAQSFQNIHTKPDELIHAEVIASTIDTVLPNLGNSCQLLQDVYFSNEILSENDTVKRGLPIYFYGNRLVICSNTVNINGAEFLFELEESLYRMATSMLCYYGNENSYKDKSYYSSLLSHISDPTLKYKVNNEIIQSANGNHSFLEDLGVIYFKDRAHLEKFYPKYVNVLDNLNMLMENFKNIYVEPDLYFSDIKLDLEGFKNHKVSPYIPPAPVNRGQEQGPVNPGDYNGQREFINEMRSKYVEFRYAPDYVLKQIYNFGYNKPDMVAYNVYTDYCNQNNRNLDWSPK